VTFRRILAAFLDLLIEGIEWYGREQSESAHPSRFPPPKPAPGFDNETTPTLRCRHNARLNERCLKCDPL
jgi:hypothetical protein